LKLYGAKLQAEQAAATDTLTGLFNRRALETHIDALLRVNKRFTLAQMDLDFFKTVNDTHGHAAGDHVLKEISKILKYETRRDDFIVRLGGDEFVMVFDGLTDIDELGQICQRIISAAQVPIPFNSTFCNVSCSIGLFCVFSGDLQADDILHNADMALYQAKAAGRSTFKVF
jgi:diguanylate cyclase (GGDEF)-like protein